MADIRKNETIAYYTNFFLGTVKWQNLTAPTLGFKVLHTIFFFNGSLMISGNALLVLVILLNKPLRRKEMYIIAGLAAGDMIYGMGYFSTAIRRLSLAFESKHLWKVTPWSCMLALQNSFFIVGSQAAGFMLVVLSLDRLLAVRWFAFYMGLTIRYAKKVILCIFGYCIFTLVGAVFLSAFFSNPEPSVPAICISTQVGPSWFGSYQPTVQLTCGILSVLLYMLTWYFYRSHVQNMSDAVQAQTLEKQRKLTRTVGITVLFTFFCYFLPNCVIFCLNTFGGKKFAAVISPYGWVLGNFNSLVNIFIMGIHNKDIRGVLNAWFHCRKPQFAGGHTVDSKSKTARFDGAGNQKNRFRMQKVAPSSSLQNKPTKSSSQGAVVNQDKRLSLPQTTQKAVATPVEIKF